MTAIPPTDIPTPTEPDVIEGISTEADASAAEHIIGMSFAKASRAEEVLLNLSHLQQEGEIRLADAVVVVKGDNEKVHIRQTVDPSPKTGALNGSMWGLFIGLLFGPIGPIVGAVAGASGGALMAKLVDIGLDDNWVKQVGEWLDPNTSALLLLVADDVHPTVLRELERFEGKVLYCTFPDAVRHELEEALAATPAEHRAGLPVAEPFARYGDGPRSQ